MDFDLARLAVGILDLGSVVSAVWEMEVETGEGDWARSGVVEGLGSGWTEAAGGGEENKAQAQNFKGHSCNSPALLEFR